MVVVIGCNSWNWTGLSSFFPLQCIAMHCNRWPKFELVTNMLERNGNADCWRGRGLHLHRYGGVGRFRQVVSKKSWGQVTLHLSWWLNILSFSMVGIWGNMTRSLGSAICLSHGEIILTSISWLIELNLSNSFIKEGHKKIYVCHDQKQHLPFRAYSQFCEYQCSSTCLCIHSDTHIGDLAKWTNSRSPDFGTQILVLKIWEFLLSQSTVGGCLQVRNSNDLISVKILSLNIQIQKQIFKE